MNPTRALICLALTAVALNGALPLHAAGEAERLLVYKVERIAPAEAPVIDGDLSEPVWRDKAAITALRNFLGPLTGELPTQRSEFVLLTDGAKLYIGATFHDQDMASVRFNPAAEPFWNDCIELHLDPAHDGSQHIQLVVDCGGRRWWHKQYDRGYGWWDDSAWYVLANWDAAGARQANSWTIEVVLDCKSFGIDARPGQVCSFNPCRFRLGAAQQEFSAWGFDSISHQKAMKTWGHLIFAAAGEKSQGFHVGPEEVARIYPNLGDRVVEVPTESGVEVFSRNGRKTTSFADTVAALVARLDERRRLARDAVAAPEAQPELARFAELDAQATALQQEATVQGLTLGTCDRLSDKTAKLSDQFDELTWRARLLSLVAHVNEGGR